MSNPAKCREAEKVPRVRIPVSPHTQLAADDSGSVGSTPPVPPVSTTAVPPGTEQTGENGGGGTTASAWTEAPSPYGWPLPARRAIDLCTCGHSRSWHPPDVRTKALSCDKGPCECRAFTPHPQPNESAVPALRGDEDVLAHVGKDVGAARVVEDGAGPGGELRLAGVQVAVFGRDGFAVQNPVPLGQTVGDDSAGGAGQELVAHHGLEATAVSPVVGGGGDGRNGTAPGQHQQDRKSSHGAPLGASLYQGGGGQAFPGVTALAEKIDGALRRFQVDRDLKAHQHSAVPAQWTVNVWQEMGTGGVPWWNAAAYEGPRYRYGTYGAAAYHGALREAVGFVRRSAGDGVAITLKGSMPEDHLGMIGSAGAPARRSPTDLDVTDPEGAAARLLDGYPADVLDAVQFELKRRREWYEHGAPVGGCESDPCREFEDEFLVRLFLALTGGES